MKPPYKISRKAVRQFLLHRQHLFLPYSSRQGTQERTLDMLKQLECIQIDSVASVTKNQHLVLDARLQQYKPDFLNTLLRQKKTFEYFANAMCVIPMEDFPIFKPIRERLQAQIAPSLKTLQSVSQEILTCLAAEGPLPSRAFKSANKVHGYWDNTHPKTKETSHALNLLFDSGVIQVAKREGSERFFDLTEHCIPKDILDQATEISLSEAQQVLIEKYIRAYRIFSGHTSRFGWLNLKAAERQTLLDDLQHQDKIQTLEIEGIKRQYYIRTEDLEELNAFETTPKKYFSHPIAFLPPLDNLLWSRERIQDFFAFDYKWEIYTPRAKRRYGPYAMPILWKDKFIGRIDATLSKQNQQFTVRLLQIEPHIKITNTLRKHLVHALNTFAQNHGAKTITIEKIEGQELTIKELL
ncbi:uncharacterized protein YcaQ [Pullulanibacillus pueri]|uniref:Winged helix-turn-helix domain-containing protein n=1 Tax=Pullulanibacillus pueri TaxID=1437324 RepID=A0A8J3EJY8_9BACL|nr:crosslink repair DNA glycosylase YcaQ family protein [Pullulanibacillus pueri]MBM7679928.1 uncharacterized protein YcaQ [Pullulanibacillus pueri]GGH73530.1 hypothetical protein GCM10007096_00850 [Pullulanibacillus pueri]